MIKKHIKLIFIILGLFNAVWLTFMHYIKEASCAKGALCSEVLQSSYSLWFGVPVAVFGAAFFVYSLAQLLVNDHHNQSKAEVKHAIGIHSFVLIAAYCASVYFILVQFFVLKAFCPFCMLNHIIVITLVLWEGTTLLSYIKQKKVCFFSQKDIYALYLLIPVLLFIVWQGVVSMPYLKPAGQSEISYIDGRAYSLAVLELKAKSKISAHKRKGYEIYKEVVDEIVLEKAAKNGGVSRDAYVRSNILRGIRISNQDIINYIEKNNDLFPKNIKESQKRQYANQTLYQERFEENKRRVLDRLYKTYSVKLGFKNPKPLEIKSNPYQVVKKGSNKASLHWIVFSDYECPACARVHRKIHELIEKYPNDISVEYRHFPLDFHRLSKDIARYAICLEKENLFWVFSKAVFNNQNNLSLSFLDKTALNLGADQSKLNMCLKSGYPDNVLKEDLKVVNHLVLQSTPSLFINGIFLDQFPSDSEIETMIKEAKDTL